MTAAVLIRRKFGLHSAGSPQHRSEEWFLFKSERAFFFARSDAGIDREKLRHHLQQWQQLGPEEMDRLLSQ